MESIILLDLIIPLKGKFGYCLELSDVGLM
jgi:hypothetical protein